MRYLLVFPNGYKADMGDRPEPGESGSEYDASWVENKELASMQWLVHAKLEQIVDNIPTLSIFMEEATQSRAFEQTLLEEHRKFLEKWDTTGDRE